MSSFGRIARSAKPVAVFILLFALGACQITSRPVLPTRPERTLKTYDVAPIVDKDDEHGEALANIIEMTLGTPPGWCDDEYIVNVTAESRDGVLFIDAPKAVHGNIRQFLDALSAPAGTKPIRIRHRPVAMRPLPPERERELADQLLRPISLRFEDTPLQVAIDRFNRVTGVTCEVDWDTLGDLGISQQTTVSLDIQNIPADRALSLILKQIETGDPFNKVEAVLDQGSLRVSTSEDFYYRTLEVVVYDTSEFSRPDNSQLQNERISSLVGAILCAVNIDPPWRSGTGTYAICWSYRNKLIIRETRNAHAEVQKIFADFRDHPDRKDPISEQHGTLFSK